MEAKEKNLLAPNCDFLTTIISAPNGTHLSAPGTGAGRGWVGQRKSGSRSSAIKTQWLD